jgi:hypothetical protein
MRTKFVLQIFFKYTKESERRNYDKLTLKHSNKPTQQNFIKTELEIFTLKYHFVLKANSSFSNLLCRRRHAFGLWTAAISKFKTLTNAKSAFELAGKGFDENLNFVGPQSILLR